VIDAGQAATGAYLASPSFPVYRYSWFRDGAFVADAMSRVGRVDSAERFFDWCTRVLVDRSDLVESQIRARQTGRVVDPSELLHCRYTVEGEEAPEEWQTFQLDGYGTWLWALGAHSARHGRPLTPYLPGIDLCVRYLAAYWREPSYDWWEENMGHQHTSTLGALYGGLEAASWWDVDARVVAAETAAEIRTEVLARGVQDGRLTKWLDGDGLDASLIACAVPFRLVEPHGDVARATAEAIESRLLAGGVHRHPDDSYYGGGEWLLLSAFLGWYYAGVGRTDDAAAQLQWIAAQADDEGFLPEQVGGNLIVPEAYDGWRSRWGPVASPLLWSHAMFLTLAAELGEVDAA
jgi:GH15 family glucan-1,4-alpha-glucosidase